MLKTNSKQARQNIRNYITANTINENNDTATTTFLEAAEVLTKCFYLAEIKHANYYSGATLQKTFEHFAQGLPNHTFDYYLHNAVDTLGDILEETEAERKHYTETQAETTLTYLIFSELSKVANLTSGTLKAARA